MTSTTDQRGIRLKEKLALVTGGASGIGRATAIRFANEGASVAVADIDESGATDTVSAIEEAGGNARGYAFDVTSETDWTKTLNRIQSEWGYLDILVNCAGISFSKPITEMTLAEWRHVIAVNLDSVFLGTSAAIKSMQHRGNGSIINVSSASGIKASPGAVAYCASKAAVIQFSKTAALECSQRNENIRINSVAPGGVKTPMWRGTSMWPEISSSEEWNAPISAVPIKRFAAPSEIAEAILYLASDESSYVNGTTLVVDGGYTA